MNNLLETGLKVEFVKTRNEHSIPENHVAVAKRNENWLARTTENSIRKEAALLDVALVEA